MPIPIPSLDDRSYQDLVDELLARIPAHTPEWTHPAPGDPGRTLIELFAWLTDTLLYRVNLVPERQRLAFLRLLGVPMRPASAGRTLLSIAFDAPENKLAQPLPAGTAIKGPVPFETRGEVTVLPVIAEAYVKRALGEAEQKEMSTKVAELSRLYPAAGRAVPYVTTPVFAGGRPEAEGFDLVTGAVDQSLWLALLAPKEGLPDYMTEIDALTTALGRSSSGGSQYLNVGVAPRLATPAFAENASPLPPIPFVWEVTTRDPANPKGVAYQPLTAVADTTKGLRTEGIIRLALPDKSVFFAPPNNVRADVDAGTGDKPPRLDDPARAARLVAWLRLRPTTNLDSLALSWVGIHCVEVDQRQTFQGVIVGQGNGQPDQEVSLPSGGIEESSFQLQVEEAGRGFVSWRRIDDLALAGVQEAVFSFDPEAGTIRFGDGVRGKIPARGARLRVALMRTGGGDAGNVPAGTLAQVQPKQPPVARLKAWQPLAAAGGKNAETLEEAERRIPALFRHRDRAVTADDYRHLAATTPGVRVGRVEVLPRFKPQKRRSEVPGVVSVMALPKRERFDAPYPRVDRSFIEAVYAQLEPRKPLGTELYVIGCEYVPLGLTVGIENPGGSEAVNTAVKEALQKYLYCQAPGGPRGDGWPLGRTVKRRELEIVVSRVEGVDGVYGPSLFTLVNGEWRRVTTSDGGESAEIKLLPWQLPELIGAIMGVGAAPAEFKPPMPARANEGLAIPLVPEVC
jgi:predicted phage baseplate assembly protein